MMYGVLIYMDSKQKLKVESQRWKLLSQLLKTIPMNLIRQKLPKINPKYNVLF